MKKQVTFLAFFFFFSSINFAQDFQSKRIYFETNSAEITLESSLVLEDLFVHLSTQNLEELLLEYYPLHDEISDQIEALSEERYLSLLSQFEFNELNVNRVVYYSEKSHVNFETDVIEDWNFITVRYRFETKKVKHEKEEVAFFNGDVIKTESFTVDVKSNQKIKLKRGTRLNIPSNAFVNSLNEPVEGKVTVKAKEIFDIESAFFSGMLTQTTDGEYLESQGMLDLKVFDKSGNELKLANGKTINVQIPVQEDKDLEAYNLYSAEKNQDGFTEWVLNQNEVEIDERPARRWYVWKRIKREERREMREKRDLIVADWKGRKKENKRKILKRYEQRARYRTRLRKKKRRLSFSTSRERDYEQLRKGQILGMTKHRWHLDTTYNELITRRPKFFNFQLDMLIPCNIDQILNFRIRRGRRIDVLPERLIVSNTKDVDVRMQLLGRFTLIKGYKENHKAIFNNLPEDTEVLIYGIKKLPTGDFEFASIKSNTNQESVSFENTEILKEDEVFKRLKALNGSSTY